MEGGTGIDNAKDPDLHQAPKSAVVIGGYRERPSLKKATAFFKVRPYTSIFISAVALSLI